MTRPAQAESPAAVSLRTGFATPKQTGMLDPIEITFRATKDCVAIYDVSRLFNTDPGFFPAPSAAVFLRSIHAHGFGETRTQPAGGVRHSNRHYHWKLRQYSDQALSPRRDECLLVARRGSTALVILLIVTLANVVVCFRTARPIPGLGLAMPAFVPPLIAASLSLLLIPDFAPPVAFVAGVLGPLIGADLLHLKEVVRTAPAIASIGGAGTFDGIVLSGLVAALLA